jgi:hypothetical protein
MLALHSLFVVGEGGKRPPPSIALALPAFHLPFSARHARVASAATANIFSVFPLSLPKDRKRAFELAAAGAALGCAHSKGALGRCFVAGTGIAKDAGRGLALGRESAAAGRILKGSNLKGFLRMD